MKENDRLNELLNLTIEQLNSNSLEEVEIKGAGSGKYMSIKNLKKALENVMQVNEERSFFYKFCLLIKNFV